MSEMRSGVRVPTSNAKAPPAGFIVVLPSAREHFGARLSARIALGVAPLLFRATWLATAGWLESRVGEECLLASGRDEVRPAIHAEFQYVGHARTSVVAGSRRNPELAGDSSITGATPKTYGDVRCSGHLRASSSHVSCESTMKLAKRDAPESPRCGHGNGMPDTFAPPAKVSRPTTSGLRQKISGASRFKSPALFCFGSLLGSRSFDRMFLKQAEEHPQATVLFLQSLNAITTVSMGTVAKQHTAPRTHGRGRW